VHKLEGEATTGRNAEWTPNIQKKKKKKSSPLREVNVEIKTSTTSMREEGEKLRNSQHAASKRPMQEVECHILGCERRRSAYMRAYTHTHIHTHIYMYILIRAKDKLRNKANREREHQQIN
jgi:hypothetical protein